MHPPLLLMFLFCCATVLTVMVLSPLVGMVMWILSVATVPIAGLHCATDRSTSLTFLVLSMPIVM